jgi:hypothetical protein
VRSPLIASAMRFIMTMVVGAAVLVGSLVAAQPPAYAEAAPCAAHAMTEHRDTVRNMSFRLMRCNSGGGGVFVEAWNLWPPHVPGATSQQDCRFRVEASPSGSSPWETCMRSAGSPRYSNVMLFTPGTHVRAAMLQVQQIPNVPESDWPVEYEGTEWVRF